MGRDVDMWRCVKSCGYLFNAVSLCHSEFDLLRTVYAFMQQLIEHMNLSCPVYSQGQPFCLMFSCYFAIVVPACRVNSSPPQIRCYPSQCTIADLCRHETSMDGAAPTATPSSSSGVALPLPFRAA